VDQLTHRTGETKIVRDFVVEVPTELDPRMASRGPLVETFGSRGFRGLLVRASAGVSTR
jgi:hypothetical protein